MPPFHSGSPGVPGSWIRNSTSDRAPKLNRHTTPVCASWRPLRSPGSHRACPETASRRAGMAGMSRRQVRKPAQPVERRSRQRQLHIEAARSRMIGGKPAAMARPRKNPPCDIAPWSPWHRRARAVAAPVGGVELSAVGIDDLLERDIRLGQAKFGALVDAARPAQAGDRGQHDRHRLGVVLVPQARQRRREKVVVCRAPSTATRPPCCSPGHRPPTGSAARRPCRRQQPVTIGQLQPSGPRCIRGATATASVSCNSPSSARSSLVVAQRTQAGQHPMVSGCAMSWRWICME